MNENRLRLVFFSLTLLSSVALAAAPPLNPGRWQITIKTEAPVSMPPTTAEVCVTKEQAAHPEPAKGKPTDDCQVHGAAMNGNVLTYTTQCGKRKSSSTAKFTYAGDSYEGVVTIKVGDMEVRQTYSAKRLGGCDSVPGE